MLLSETAGCFTWTGHIKCVEATGRWRDCPLRAPTPCQDPGHRSPSVPFNTLAQDVMAERGCILIRQGFGFGTGHPEPYIASSDRQSQRALWTDFSRFNVPTPQPGP